MALAAGNLSDVSYQTLRQDGWKVHRVSTIDNPGRWTQGNTRGKKFPQRFWGVYTKLLVFNLTQYERVIYLDADCIALRNIDELFLCDGFCGVMRHSERLNSGVMVIGPSEKMFQHMIEHIADTPSYTGGDQGFINEFFSEFVDSPFFDPDIGKPLSQLYPDWKDKRGRRMARLPTLYNADLGLFVLNSNRWTLPEHKIGVLHYTLANFKPWDWWTSWIIAGSAGRWQELRKRLPPATDGHILGETQGQYLARWVLIPLPWILAAILIRKFLWDEGLGSSVCWRINRSKWTPVANSEGGGSQGGAGRSPPVWFGAAASGAGVVSLGLAMYITTSYVVPRQIMPVYGWVLAYEWMTLFMCIFYALYLKLCYTWGAKSTGAGMKPGSKPYWCGTRPWGETLLQGGSVLLILWLLPWWADLLRVASFVTKVLTTGVAGAVSFAACTQLFASLAATWYTCGSLEAGNIRANGDIKAEV